MTDDEPRPVPPRRRRTRLAAGDVRTRMFAAAKEIIAAHGVTISLEDIAMDDVVFRAGVARSSAYRLWPYKGDFVNDLLLNLSGPIWMNTAGIDARALETATTVVLTHWERANTAEGRRAVLEEVVRQAVGENVEAVVKSIEWEVYTALMATSRGNGNDETRQQLAAELERAAMSFVDAMAGFYAAMCNALGLRLRDEGMTFRHLALAGEAAVEGVALRKKLVQANAHDEQRAPAGWSLGDLVDAIPGPAIDGEEPARWSLAAVAFLAVFDAMTEPDPAWEPTPEARRAIEELQRHIREEMGAPPATA